MFIITTIIQYYSAEIAVLILARGGSKGVRLKNLQKVGDKSLLSRSIHTAKAAGFYDITVSTDNPIIALESIRDNVTVFRRSFVTATDWAPSIWGAREFLLSRPKVTILILLQVTSPFTQPIHLKRGFEIISRPVPFDCVFSVTRSYKLRWQFQNGKLNPINFNVDARMRRQDWSGELLESGAFYITRRRLLESGKFQNNNCTVIEVSATESLEIDTPDDLLLANTLLKNNLVPRLR